MGLIGSNKKSEVSKLCQNKMIDHIQNPYIKRGLNRTIQFYSKSY